MMLCKADFDEIFSSGQKRTDAAKPASGPAHPDNECLARWEDDGGRVLPNPSRRRARAARRDEWPLQVSHPVRTGMALATMPAAAAYGAAWTMFSAYHQMTRS